MYTLHKYATMKTLIKVNLVTEILILLGFPGSGSFSNLDSCAKGDSSVFLAIYSQLLTWPHCQQAKRSQPWHLTHSKPPKRSVERTTLIICPTIKIAKLRTRQRPGLCVMLHSHPPTEIRLKLKKFVKGSSFFILF
jgi:hypothetical protein